MTTEFANNASTTLSGTLAIGGTTANVTSDAGFPAITAPDYCFATLEDTSGNIEIIKITAHTASSNVFTVVKAQDGTADQAWASGDLIEMRLTAVNLEELRDHDHDATYGQLATTNTWTDDNDFTGGFTLDGTGVTATGTELNKLASYTGDIPELGTTNTWTAQQRFTEATLTDAASISWNLDTAQTAKVTLAGNRTLANPTNMDPGATYILRVIQDASGSRTLAFGSAYKWPSGTAPTMSTGANDIDILSFYSDGTNMLGVFTGNLS